MVVCFRRHAFDMQHGGGRGGAEGGAERLEVVPRRFGGGKATQQGNAVGCGAAGEIADDRPEGVVDILRQLDVDDALGLAVFVEIDA